MNIIGISECILSARDDGHWHIDVRNIILWRMKGSISFEIANESIIEFAELPRSHLLNPMHEVLHTGAGWCVCRIEIETSLIEIIIGARITTNQ